MWTAQVQFTDKQVEEICNAAKDEDMTIDDFVQMMMAEALTKKVWKR